MSNINKQALREAAEKAISEEGETWWSEGQLASDYGLALHRADAKFISTTNPATVLALLDELEAAKLDSARWFKAFEKAVSVGARYEERIAELEAREVKLPDVEKWRSPEAVRAQNAYRVLVGRELSAAGIITKVGE